jgi:hypothetical protein
VSAAKAKLQTWSVAEPTNMSKKLNWQRWTKMTESREAVAYGSQSRTKWTRPYERKTITKITTTELVQKTSRAKQDIKTSVPLESNKINIESTEVTALPPSLPHMIIEIKV